jgi:hypothetical protein
MNKLKYMKNSKLIRNPFRKRHFAFYILYFAFCISIMQSCSDDFLDMPSDGRVTLEDVFAQRNTIVNYYNSLLGVGVIPTVGFTYMSRNNFAPLAVFCDEAEDVNNYVGSAPYYWYSGGTSAVSNPLYDGYSANNAWDYYFAAIRRCNTFLQQIPSHTAMDIQPAEVAGIAAEVKVIRAYAYLQLMKRYGDVPLTDTPYDITHDYSQDRRASVEAITDFIITQCDEALATPEEESLDMAFLWTLKNEGQRGKIPRAFALAVKSQTALYAASPLLNPNSSGTYTWAKAAEITKDALDQCLLHGYELYSRKMNDDMSAKTLNTYGYYFIQRSDPTRALDRETIFESREQTSIWTNAALPTWQGGLTAGACPSQELVDAYEMQGTGKLITENGSGYNENNPYEGRDPRFYASIYYNGALRSWIKGEANYLNPRFNNNYSSAATVSVVADTATVTATGASPSIETGMLQGEIRYAEAYVVFDYVSDKDVNDAHFYVATGSSPVPASTMTSEMISLPKAETWTSFRYDLKDLMNYGFGKQTINGAIASEHRLGLFLNESELNIKIRVLRIEMATPPVAKESVETFVGGNCGISASASDVRYTRTGYYLRKFNSAVSATGSNDDGYFKIFRLAELYLNFAEAAYNALSPDAKYGALSALDAVNAVRARAEMPPLPAGMSSADFEKRYRNERRVELAFEEHRFFDVRRWKILSETDKGVTGMRITKSENGTLTYERVPMATRQTYADKYLLLPIPQSEVAKMFQYTGQNWQNPGW